jgi:hypothetical protein
MLELQFFTTDDRYSVPSLLMVQTKDISAARALAERLLAENTHYEGIDVWADEKLIFSLDHAD